MSRFATILCAALASTVPLAVHAQAMAGMDMKGMKMPAPSKKPVIKKPALQPAGKATSPGRLRAKGKAAKPAARGAMSDMVMPAAVTAKSQAAMPGMDMSGDGQATGAMPTMAMTGTALPAGNDSPPLPPMDHYSDRILPAADMARARQDMMRDSGGQNFAQIMLNLAEVQIRNSRDGYRWDGEGWFGGDINRLTVKTEGSGVFREGVDSAEVQALYSRAVGPYFNLQAGVRHDLRPSSTRTYATVGFEGLAPYWFEVSGALFLSSKGDVIGRIEGYYDQRVTQRLILQPRVELNLSVQDVPEERLGAGLTDVELGLRLRFEISRQFAPYVGVSYEAKTGPTADFARSDGRKPTSTSLVAGVRFWF